MAYTEESVIDRMEILEDGQIQVRRADKVLKDGVEISRTFCRHVVAPNISTEDLLLEDPKVQAVANAIFTQEVKDAFLAKIAANTNL